MVPHTLTDVEIHEAKAILSAARSGCSAERFAGSRILRLLVDRNAVNCRNGRLKACVSFNTANGFWRMLLSEHRIIDIYEDD